MLTFKRAGLLVIFVCAMSVVSFAQMAAKVYKAELSVNFGTAKGRIVTAGDLMLFVDDENSDGSFAVEKSAIKSWNEQDGVIMIETARPVKDRSGERSKLAFRLMEGNGAMLAAWYKEAGMMKPATETMTAKNGAAKPEETPGAKVYQAKQKRFPVGTTSGKLIITDGKLAFESFEDVKRSRQWEYKEIKQLKQSGPYILEVTPFSGEKYKLELEGEGITTSEFKALTDRIAAARVSK